LAVAPLKDKRFSHDSPDYLGGSLA
jgi:hypothetical protein